MRRPAGSWPVLLGLLAAYWGLFAWLRADSPFLRIEAELPTARRLAAAAAVGVDDALALRDLVGGAAPVGRWAAACARFASLRTDLGDELAAVALAGDEPAATAALRRAGGDAAAAWREFRSDRAALPGLRFVALRERFAARLPAGDRDD